MGTTSIGFNLFLGGAMAKGRSLGSTQRGIAFSTISAFVVSVLILIVGAGYHNDPNREQKFTITDLGSFIEKFVGVAGVTVYALGFIAAALSSMLTVPLGAALTADSVFSDDADENNDVDAEGDTNAAGDKYTVSDKIPVPTSPSKVPMSPEKSERISISSPVSPPTSPEKKLLPPSYKSLDASELDLQSGVMDNQNTITENGIIRPSNSQPSEVGLTMDTTVEESQKLPRWIYLGIMFGMVIISVIVISANGKILFLCIIHLIFQ